MATVLLVEDEPNIAEIILFKLRREGHTVTHVETLAAAVPGEWDLVILDSSLPGEDPIGFVRTFGGAVPIAIMTESRDESTGGVAREAGAVAIVPKPFKPTLLARLVVELTELKGDANHSKVVGADGLMVSR